MELATTVYLVARTLAKRAFAGAGLAPRALPVWTIEPWFNVVFHSLSCVRYMGFYYTAIYSIEKARPIKFLGYFEGIDSCGSL